MLERGAVESDSVEMRQSVSSLRRIDSFMREENEHERPVSRRSAPFQGLSNKVCVWLMELVGESSWDEHSLCREMERDYEGEAYERGYEPGLWMAGHLGMGRDSGRAFLAAIPVATEIIQLKSRFGRNHLPLG